MKSLPKVRNIFRGSRTEHVDLKKLTSAFSGERPWERTRAHGLNKGKTRKSTKRLYCGAPAENRNDPASVRHLGTRVQGESGRRLTFVLDMAGMKRTWSKISGSACTASGGLLLFCLLFVKESMSAVQKGGGLQEDTKMI